MAYNPGNSLTPMMFRKKKKEAAGGGGTRNERWRSRSVENIFDAGPSGGSPKQSRSKSTVAPLTIVSTPWKELDRLKGLAPVITCVIPSLAMDFVASALLATGATPIVVEDPADVPQYLQNSKGVVVDTSAPQVIIESLLDNYERGSIPLVLVTTHSGVDDRKKELALKLIEKTDPTMVSGRMGDIVAITQSWMEKVADVSPLDSLSSDSDDDDDITSKSAPLVIINDKDMDTSANRRRKFRKTGVTCTAGSSTSSGSPPLTSPRGGSPFVSPKNSPSPSPRGVRKFLQKVCKKQDPGGPLHRVPTVLPRLKMKGQYRETQMCQVSSEDALENAQKLSAQTKSMVHVYETNVVTNGEVVLEINNNQIGMGNLHSTLLVSGAVTAAVLACVTYSSEKDEDDIELKHCGHGLALYYVAAEAAAAAAIQKNEIDVALPGTLREKFIDSLCFLNEEKVHSEAVLIAYSGSMKSQWK